MSAPDTIKLKKPVEFGKDTFIEELTFRRGRAGDLRGIRLGNDVSADDLIKIAGRLCDQPSAVIERLDEEDAAEAFARALGFFGRCLSTGNES